MKWETETCDLKRKQNNGQLQKDLGCQAEELIWWVPGCLCIFSFTIAFLCECSVSISGPWTSVVWISGSKAILNLPRRFNSNVDRWNMSKKTRKGYFLLSMLCN